MSKERYYCQICGEPAMLPDAQAAGMYGFTPTPCKHCGGGSYKPSPKPHAPDHEHWRLTEGDEAFLRTQGIKPR